MILPPVRWYCPNCTEAGQTAGIPKAQLMHPCPGLRGLHAPLVREGTRAVVTVTEREDYVGSESVQLDPELGRPVAFINTIRDDGNDVIVLAPVASVGVAAQK